MNAARILAALLLALAANALLALGVAELARARAGGVTPAAPRRVLPVVLVPPPEQNPPEQLRRPLPRRERPVHTARRRRPVPAPPRRAAPLPVRRPLSVRVSPELPLAPLADLHLAPAPAPLVTAGLPGVDEPPRKVFAPPPPYPPAARRRGLQGTVEVRLLVDRRGRVVEAYVLRARPAGVFEDVVLRTVRRWRFRPARVDGRPVSCWCEQTFSFSLWQHP